MASILGNSPQRHHISSRVCKHLSGCGDFTIGEFSGTVGLSFMLVVLAPVEGEASLAVLCHATSHGASTRHTQELLENLIDHWFRELLEPFGRRDSCVYRVTYTYREGQILGNKS